MDLLLPPEDIELTESPNISMNELLSRQNVTSSNTLNKTERVRYGWQDNYNDYIIRRLKPSFSSDEDKLTHIKTHSRIIFKDLKPSNQSNSTSLNYFSANLDQNSAQKVNGDDEDLEDPTIIEDYIDQIKLKPVQALKLNIHEVTRTKLCEAIEKKEKEKDDLRLKLEFLGKN